MLHLECIFEVTIRTGRFSPFSESNSCSITGNWIELHCCCFWNETSNTWNISYGLVFGVFEIEIPCQLENLLFFLAQFKETFGSAPSVGAHGMDLGTDSSLGCDFELLRYSQPGGCAEALDAWTRTLALLKININQQVHKINTTNDLWHQVVGFCFGLWWLPCRWKLPRISVNFMTRTFIGAFSACPGLLLRISGASRDTEVFGRAFFRPLFGKLRGVYQHTQAQYKGFKISKQKVWKYKIYDNSEKETYCSLTPWHKN